MMTRSSRREEAALGLGISESPQIFKSHKADKKMEEKEVNEEEDIEISVSEIDEESSS